MLEIAPAIIVVVTRKESLYSLGITRINILKSLFVGFISYFLYFAFNGHHETIYISISP